jgi:tripartite-type tricarboxylate transporter receptor subunit TctC
LRALVLSSKKRSQKLPDIPTAAEAGYPIFTGDQWVGVLVPAGTPEEIVSLLHRSIVGITRLPDVKERLDALDFYEIDSTPTAFAARIRSELESWRKVVEAAHLRPG